jgi:Ca2+-binding EF-hand superfamily protein
MFQHMFRILIIWSITTASYVVSADSSQSDKPENHPRHPPAFSAVDLDGNGSITLEEFKQHKLTHNRHQRIFNHIDRDGDQLISEQELKDHKPPRHKKGEHRQK